MTSLSSLLKLLGVTSIHDVLDILGVGFRFQPTDQEIMSFLNYKMVGNESKVEMIPLVDVCKFEPWDLPDVIAGRSKLNSTHDEWFCFCTPDYKYRNSNRVNRATDAGYWKPTGQDRQIKAEGTKKVIGKKKTLVFYEGRVPNGVKTSWIIHEYRPKSVHPDQDFVLCRLMKKAEKKRVKTNQSDDDLGNTNSNMACDSNCQTPIEVHFMMQENQEPLCILPNQSERCGLSCSPQLPGHISVSDLGFSNVVGEENQFPLLESLQLPEEVSELLFILQSPGQNEQGLSVSDHGNAMMQEFKNSLSGSLFLTDDSHSPSTVQFPEQNEFGLSLSDLSQHNESAEGEGQGLSVTDCVGNEGKLSEIISNAHSWEDKTEFVNSLLILDKDCESSDDIVCILCNDIVLPESLACADEEAILSSDMNSEAPVGIYPPNETMGDTSGGSKNRRITQEGRSDVNSINTMESDILLGSKDSCY